MAFFKLGEESAAMQPLKRVEVLLADLSRSTELLATAIETAQTHIPAGIDPALDSLMDVGNDVSNDVRDRLLTTRDMIDAFSKGNYETLDQHPDTAEAWKESSFEQKLAMLMERIEDNVEQTRLTMTLNANYINPLFENDLEDILDNMQVEKDTPAGEDTRQEWANLLEVFHSDEQSEAFDSIKSALILTRDKLNPTVEALEQVNDKAFGFVRNVLDQNDPFNPLSRGLN